MSLNELHVKQFESASYGADDAVKSFVQRRNGIFAIKVLRRLTQAVQKHRGASIACTHSASQFIPMAEQLQVQIHKLLQLLVVSVEQFGALPKNKLYGAINDWESILHGWSEDDVIHNYEFHSHLVEVLYGLMRECIAESHLFDQQSEQDLVLANLLHTIPQHIESLARLRGLVTYTAELGACNHDCYIRISYLHKKVLEDFRELNHSLKQLHHGLPKIISLDEILAEEYQLTYLLEMIEKDILQKQAVSADADEMFKLATAAIDNYWAIVDQAILLSEQKMFSNYLLV